HLPSCAERRSGTSAPAWIGMPSDSMKSSYAPRPQKDGRFCSVALAALVSLIVRTLYRISMRWDTCAPVFQDFARTVRVAATLGAGAIRKKGDKVLDDFFGNLQRELSAA